MTAPTLCKINKNTPVKVRGRLSAAIDTREFLCTSHKNG